MTNRIIWVPGWAMPRVYYEAPNRIVIETSDPLKVADELAQIRAKYPHDQLWVFGHSLGGFILSKALSELLFWPDYVVFVGIRRAYPAAELRGMQRMLGQDRDALLRGFFNAAAPGRPIWDQYGAVVGHDWSDERLHWGLTELDRFHLPLGPCQFVHGASDQIAPISEAESIAQELDQRILQVPNGDHLLDLSEIESQVISHVD